MRIEERFSGSHQAVIHQPKMFMGEEMRQLFFWTIVDQEPIVPDAQKL